MPAPTRALLFDLDNTLFDRQHWHQRFCGEQLRRSSLAAGEQESLLPQLMERDQWGYSPREEYFTWFAEQLKLPETGAELWRGYCRWFRDALRPDVELTALLEPLQERFLLGLVTNGSSEQQRNKLHGLGLAGHFDVIVISEEAGVKKPDPAIFQTALRQLECLPAETWMLGDDPSRDVAGAMALGMRSVWISHQRPWPVELTPPEVVIPTIHHLPDYLSRITFSHD